MQKYIERMISERQDLVGKIKRAEKAIENPPYGSNKEGLLLLAEQVKSMKDYLQCLENRIKYEQEK